MTKPCTFFKVENPQNCQQHLRIIAILYILVSISCHQEKNEFLFVPWKKYGNNILVVTILCNLNSMRPLLGGKASYLPHHPFSMKVKHILPTSGAKWWFTMVKSKAAPSTNPILPSQQKHPLPAATLHPCVVALCAGAAVTCAVAALVVSVSVVLRQDENWEEPTRWAPVSSYW